MCRLAESSFQSLSSRFGSISGCRSKVFLSPACGGVESSAEPIMEIPHASVRHYPVVPFLFCKLLEFVYDKSNKSRYIPTLPSLSRGEGKGVADIILLNAFLK